MTTTLTVILFIAIGVTGYYQIKLNNTAGRWRGALTDAAEIARKRLDNQEAVIRAQQKLIEELQTKTNLPPKTEV